LESSNPEHAYAEQAARWRSHFDGLRIPAEKLDAVFEEIVSRYSEPHRAYHNLRHIEQVLDVVDYLARYAVDIQAVRLAAWFHDIVYDPRGQENEAASADLARELLAQVGYMSKGAVASMILATRDHEHEGADLDTLVLLDADLAILGASPETYEEYAMAIRKEYFWVPDARFYTGRSDVLRRLLSRATLFALPEMRERFEAQARRNMEAELQSLE
jgi:predicted metal-dependent HD superfamily phosphohydrolase